VAYRDREKYNAYMREYMRHKYQSRVSAAIEVLGGKCVVCGSTSQLEIDHKLPLTKISEVTDLTTKSSTTYWKEVDKCQVLCKACHLDKTLAESGKKHAKGVHGTLTNYITYGCRCTECRAAKAAYYKEYKQRRKALLLGV
jgi:5-methylcytosine-specific restriction endonuclease McrA